MKAGLFLFLPPVIILLATGGAEARLSDNATISIAVSSGFHLNSLCGYPGKVGEYEVLDDGAETEFLLTGFNDDTSFQLKGSILDRDDQSYSMRIAKGTSLLTRLSFSRFQHYLDHDGLENQDFMSDQDAGCANVLTIEDIAASNEISPPFFPFIKLLLDWRNYNKRGHRQSTTVTGCAQCHVSSMNMRVNSQLEDITAGVQAEIWGATVSYTHLWRSFREHGDTPVVTYREDSSFYPTSGSQYYGGVPDSRSGEHKIELRSPLLFSSFLSSAIRWGTRTNRDTRQDISFNSFSGLVAKSINRFVSGNAFYAKAHTRNKAPTGISRMKERGGVSFSVRPAQQGYMHFTCQWESIDRRNFDITTTDKRLYRLNYRQRLLRKIQLYAQYEKQHTDDQFLQRDPTFMGVAKTALPDDQDTVQTSATWEPGGRTSLSANLRYTSSTYRDYHVDENRWEYGMTGWFSPVKNLSVTAAWTIMDTNITTPATFSNWHNGSRTELLFTDTIPYDSRANMYYGSISYSFNPRLFFNGQFTRISSTADFDAMVDDENIGGYSDVKINSVEYSLAMTFQQSRRLSLYVKYRFREYDDKNISSLDGRFAFISLGLTWRM